MRRCHKTWHATLNRVERFSNALKSPVLAISLTRLLFSKLNFIFIFVKHLSNIHMSSFLTFTTPLPKMDLPQDIAIEYS